MSHKSNLNRREFFVGTTVASAITGRTWAAAGGVSIVMEPSDSTASAKPAVWAAKELEDALAGKQIAVHRVGRIADAPAGDLCIVAGSRNSEATRDALSSASATLPSAAEGLALSQSNVAGRQVLVAAGADTRGLVYALLELADRVHYANEPLSALQVSKPIIEQPHNRIRSMNRSFVSDIEDSSWYYDRSFWKRYLSMLAAERFNRVNLTLGLGYNFPRDVHDAYFYFAYPFLVSIPGYDVHVPGVPAAERERNLEMLRFISDEAVARGLDFQLGLWTHAYRWVDSPHANYVIEGLTPEKHAPYCRDALHAVLQACPAITGLTFRIHGESGVPEGNYDFWKTVFDGAVRSGRKLEIDMHAKGMTQQMIDVALATGLPVVVSPKFWAEHMGLSYNQASIRELEMPDPDRKVEGPMTLSTGSRSFLRYGYGDLLKEDRRYGIWYRIWPGTQRHLLWGDPLLAAGYGRASNFCGSDGVDICEPLSFKGRMGSGIPGGRNAYEDASLRSKPDDWQKFAYTYRIWGRLLYNPETEPYAWRRMLHDKFGSAAPPWKERWHTRAVCFR